MTKTKERPGYRAWALLDSRQALYPRGYRLVKSVEDAADNLKRVRSGLPAERHYGGMA